MPFFIKLSKEYRIKLFQELKEKSKLSFNKLYLQFNISRTMFYNYYSGKYLIPKDLFKKFQKISRINNLQYTEIKRPKFIPKKFIKPSLTESLSEIFGILNGDGHISKINHEVCVVLSYLEQEYFDYIKILFESIFKLKFTSQKQNTAIKLRCYSKELSSFLEDIYNFPRGNKLGRLKIPQQLFNSNKFLMTYIRGLFDTDGSFFIRRKKEPVIQITSADPIYLKQIKDTLIYLGFNAKLSGTHIHIYNRDHIHKFFKIIKPANTKHLKKYQNYIQYALVV